MKSLTDPRDIYETVSYPARGMGIEIMTAIEKNPQQKSYPARGMGIEIFALFVATAPIKSYPARGMGIEIYLNNLESRW